MQEITVEILTKYWYLPVPLSGRSYRVELGYRKISGSWISLASSAVALVPGLHPSKEISDQFVPFSLDHDMRQSLLNLHSENDTKETTNLHEILYKKASLADSHRRHLGLGSEAFGEVKLSYSSDLAAGQQHSGMGVLEKGFTESGAALNIMRKSEFWLEADAELIVYGATDPTATISIGDEIIKIDSDGTFCVQVPFRDGQQIYPIKAELAEGEQNRHIILKFERRTPIDTTIVRNDVSPNWFKKDKL